MTTREYWEGCPVVVTGHTGFKGAWLTFWLRSLGARVTGYALEPDTSPNLFDLLGIAGRCDSRFGDIRDRRALGDVFQETRPQVVFHLAAQSLVRRGYLDPIDTFETNVLGTANVLEAVRACGSVQAVVVVTSDKCYANDPPRTVPFVETDPLGGHDPYSASKACAEIVASSYAASYLRERGVLVATARAGNVIGGGDWSADRIIPDIIRSLGTPEALELRNPQAVRPWQHVFESLNGYLLLGQHALAGALRVADAWNFGPDPRDVMTVEELVDAFLLELRSGRDWIHVPSGLYEAPTLRLDATKARSQLGWAPRLTTREAVKMTADWYRRVLAGEQAARVSAEQLGVYAA